MIGDDRTTAFASAMLSQQAWHGNIYDRSILRDLREYATPARAVSAKPSTPKEKKPSKLLLL